MGKQNKFLLFTALLIFLFPSGAVAQVLDWHSTNLQLLRGHSHEVGERKRTIFTLEHANKWAYGDNYAWVDVTFPDNGSASYYGEVSPRLSLSKMTGYDFSNRFISDVLLSTTWEKPEHAGPRYLYGGAVDLKVPGFSYFKTNAYVRDNTQIDGRTWQVTLAWKYPYQIGAWGGKVFAGRKGVIEGFSDLAGREGKAVANQQVVPRLLLDVSDVVGAKEGKLFVGTEWHYWHNKFGIKGANQSVPQAQIKLVF